MLTISIVTPSFNQGSFIEETIRSVLTQNIAMLDYHIIDGGSNDATVSILQKYTQQLHWVSEKDDGQADAVNKGIQKSTGEIIGWLNSDDIYFPDTVNKVLQYFAAHPEVDLIYGNAWQIDRDSNVIEKYPTEPWSLSRLKVQCFISQPAVFFRRRVIEKYGLLDKRLQFCMDYEYWLRLALKGATIAHLPEYLAGTRIYAETKSSRFFLQAHVEAINMLKNTLGYIPPEWLVNYTSAKVKVETGRQLPNPKFMLDLWIGLWKTVGVYHHGLARFGVWCKTQIAIVKKLYLKLVMV